MTQSWYQRNKEKVKAERAAKRAAMTPEELEAERAKSRAYSAKWDAAHREQRRLAQKKVPKERKAAIAKKYYDTHPEYLEKIKEQQKSVRQRDKEAKATADVLNSQETAKALGITTQTLYNWIRAGKIESIKNPSGQRMFPREIIDRIKTTTGNSDGPTHVIKAVRKAGDFLVPDGFDLIQTYEELTEYTNAFAKKKFGFLLLVGSPGSGKSKQMQNHLKGTSCKWIAAHVTTLGLYCSMFEAANRPVVLDDVNHFLKDKLAVSLLKSLTQTDDEKCVSWESSAKYLDDREVPREFTTKSPVCMIANMWDVTNADMAAIQDRATPVAFYPTAKTIHERVIDLGWCDWDIVDYIGEYLEHIPQPSMREYWQGMRYKEAGMNWQAKLKALWGIK